MTPDHVAELERAMAKAISCGMDIADITKGNFTLPYLGQVLSSLQHELVHGRGFALVRGLKIDGYTGKEIETIFFGLGSHNGHARSQNAAGHALGHVRDLGDRKSVV